ncbi:MAG: alpha-1,2-fucosyltransferase [Tepidisphaeraceae bacterium]|jgi:hypothetical protein
MSMQTPESANVDGTVVVRVAEGLGNQLCQYALGLSLTTKHQATLYLDTSFYSAAGTKRSFLLPHLLECRAKLLATVQDVQAVLGEKPRTIAEPDMGFHRIELRPGDRCHLAGWWQNYGYVYPVEKLIVERICRRTTFAPPKNSIGIHVRGGDYRKRPEFNVVNRDYYARAIDNASSLVAKPKFFIFADDREYARELLPPRLPGEYMNTDNAVDDLLNLAKCTHQVIANTSFGWWAGILNPNPTKRVFIPARWFNRDGGALPAHLRINPATPYTVQVHF